MKCCILAIGGAGEQAARAFANGVLAGVTEQEQVDVLLVDTDQPRGDLISWCADHALLRALWQDDAPRGFRTALNCRVWREALPEDCATLADMATTPEDALLLQTILDEEGIHTDLRYGLHGRSDVGAAMLWGMLHAEDGHPVGALEDVLNEARQALAAGEAVRLVLIGSAMGGLGAAGLTVLTQYLREHLPQAETAAVVLLPYFRGEDAQVAQSRAALRQWAEDGLCDTVYLLGLEESAYLTAMEGHQQARLPEWLAAVCAEEFFRTGRKGNHGWRTALDHFGWDAFGEDAARYRQGFTALVHGALALRHEMGEVIRRGVTDPRWLRDKLIGWYAPHFMPVRKMDAPARAEIVHQLDALLRLTEGCLQWLDEVIASLPPQLRTGSDMDAAVRASQENYDQLVKQDAQLALLRQSAERSGWTDGMVHRGGMADPEQEQMLHAIETAQARLQQLEAQQRRCLQRTGGQAHLAILRQTEVRCREEADHFRAQTEEAARLIRQAEDSAADRGRIATARTKLQRMEQSLVMLEARCSRVRQDLATARAENVRTLPPEVSAGQAAACDLFSGAMLHAVDRRGLEEAWPGLAGLRSAIAAYPAAREPMAGFVAALMNDEGENA